MKSLNEYLFFEKLKINTGAIKNTKLVDINILVFKNHYEDGEQYFIINNDDESIGNFLTLFRREDFNTNYKSLERNDELKMEIEIFKRYINNPDPDLSDIEYYDGENEDFNPERDYIIYSFADFISKIQDKLNDDKTGYIDLEDVK